MALYNLYAEQSVLGSILIEPESILVANQFNLCVNDFFHPQHQILYNCIKKMDGQDMIKLANEVKATVLDSPLDSVTSGGLNFGTLTVLTGSLGSGKSTFLNQIIANALSLGFNSFLYSGELTAQMALDWFYKTVANPIHLSFGVNSFEKTIKVTDEGVIQINKWLKNKLFLFSKNAQADETNISTVIEFLSVKKDVKLFVLDNLMTIECSGSDKYEKQINVIKSLKNLAKHYNIVIILVAHSNKNSIQRREPHVFDISGASEIANLSDYILNATRDNDRDNETTILLLKNRITGLIKKHLQLKFSPDRKRFYTGSKLELERDYAYGEVYEQESFC